MLSLILWTCLGGSLAQAQSFDPPNMQLEEELHKKYLESQSRSKTSELSSEMASGEIAKDAYFENYNIQSGETLWSLSKILYGDGNYWPRVWSQNHAITNPHLIRPGHQLQFLLGSEDDTPAFRISEPGEDSSGAKLAAASSGPVIEIPPPEVPTRPVIQVPMSFPEWQSVFRPAPLKPNVDESALSRKRDGIADRIYLKAWVEEKDFEPIGFFMENDTESGLPVVNQYVFVKLKKGEGHTGQKLLIAHSAGKIRTVQDKFENDIPAYLIQVAGELQITEAMSSDFLRSRDREDFEAFRAIMTKTTGLSLNGNALIAGEIQYANLNPNGPHGTTVAQVIGSERNTTSMLFGQGDIVFLNRGSNAGIEVGQILDIYGNRKSRYPGTHVEFSPAASGRVKIIRVSNLLSTALILSAHDSIIQGDRVQEVSNRPQEVEKLPKMDLTPIPGGLIPSHDSNAGAGGYFGSGAQ